MEKKDIKSLNLENLTKIVSELGEKPFRAKQIYQWMHVKLAAGFDEMTNLPKQLREQLIETCELTVLETADMKVSQIDGTRKYLFRLHDGNVIESVLMKYKHGNSVCISSQVGCRMGCRFCASTLDGLERNLTPAEMLDQIYRIQASTGERVSNVVVMGSGEPMDNYDNLVQFIRLISDENGLNISQRNITVSTCGIVPGIRKLAREHFQITLALSLHAPNDEVRKSLMPVAKSYKLSDVLAACHEYYLETGRRLTFEYSLVSGVNDNLEEARALADLIKDQHGHVNLIPVNPIKERDYVQSGQKAIQAFKNYLEKNGINVTIRREMGRDINGACGQLRKSFMDKEG
ncbi:23S rRNA (adenine(2503)-C(2))-methyltransferase RlmN [Clostridium sp. MCC353]|uniref:23S rRNA (adenine(2503)-C(2))-methyltransferase RlmN n=1 Tax=Clostridium sp. MCC353 TaxID=2592646 RepID=UPI001C021FC2|nr:23S rRNA (adenine(2503)-C(2))-methyltransferase RlmN [Clostridium sp. MCC353]MBT9779283.1 23S rRNA (adenine(2503)-C(2))-methyltransferase RlmN [Clostridium sp. MCC353]